ncbi:asparaginase [Shimazuella sp. AN120528]|uniref:asparaginase n=1 Tax=Shimazuella soli TaxID=1892854 RepID=UPI001F0F449F|nr:asparaginase [Shimazuella soli]MCH5586495.1 asparaginase [Shimazuella soli]
MGVLKLKKKLLLLATGGTIASLQGDNGLVPGMTPDELIRFVDKVPPLYQLDTKRLMNIDSTNMQPESWITIAEAVRDHYADYDGFVITHGTDTMAYTSSALSYMLQQGSKPIVLTGSQVPMNFEPTDAKRNLQDAIRFACEDVAGVFVVFNGRVIQGTRAVKIKTKSYDAFESINHPYIGYVDGEEITYPLGKPTNDQHVLLCDTSVCTDVIVVKLYPGIKPELFDYLKQAYKGVIIESFGSGGIPIVGRNLLPKIEELIDSGIAVVITTQCLEEGEDLHRYEVGRKVVEKSIIHTRNMNTEAIVAKLMWTLGKSNVPNEVKQLMETPIAHDRLAT